MLEPLSSERILAEIHSLAGSSIAVLIMENYLTLKEKPAEPAAAVSLSRIGIALLAPGYQLL